jgi:hypothetical protein
VIQLRVLHLVTLIMPLMGANQKSRRHTMTKHASTSNCVGKDGGGGCGGVPLPMMSLPSPCSPPSLCTPLLPSMELRLSKSYARQTKCQMRIDYDWDDEEANFVKEYLFPRYKFLKDRRMEYDDGPDILSSLLWGKVKIPEGADCKDQWERVICPTIQTKYVTIRCNLNNEV